MTASTAQFPAVSDILAQPANIQPRGMNGSEQLIIKAQGSVLTTSTDDIGDIILLTPVPWEAKIHSIKIFAEDMDTGGTTLAVDLGIYTIDRNGTVTEAVASTSRAAYLTANTFLTAATPLGFECLVQNTRDLSTTVLADAGLTSVPKGTTAVLALFVTAVATTSVATAKLKIQVHYTI